MRIDEIEIRNFRGFYERTFTFDPHMNVVVGNNTSGKTSLLHAVQISLGAYLKCLGMLPTGNQYYRRSFAKTDFQSFFNESTQREEYSEERPYIKTKGLFTESIENMDGGDPQHQEVPVEWIRVFNNNTSDHGGLKAKTKELARMRKLGTNQSRAIMPVLFASGASRMTKNYKKISTNKKETYAEKAYKCALNEIVDFRGAFDWIYHFDRNLEKGLEFVGNNDAFINAIIEAIPAIKEIFIDPKNAQFIAQYQVTELPTDYQPYEKMSDGFKSTIGIVAEIAYRCILLNGFLGSEAVHETPGIVMIDEVDQYLHPRWQRHILHDLRNAFPNIQFIVTTHSPFIIQSVQNKNLIILDGVKEPIDPSNMGLEDISEALMGMKTRLRSQKYQDKFALTTKYYELVKEGHSKDADIMRIKQELDKLEQEKDLIDDPGLAALLKSERQGL